MFDLAAELSGWAETGRDFAVATVVKVSGSAPRTAGATLAVETGAGEPSPHDVQISNWH